MRRMPEWPAVSARQLSCLPAPSEVSTPMPVTTTTGRPRLIEIRASHRRLLRRLDHAPAPRRANGPRTSPAPGATRPSIGCLGGFERREQPAARQRHRRQRQVGGERRLQRVAERRRRGAHRKAQFAQESASSRGRRGRRRRRRRSPPHAAASDARRIASSWRFGVGGRLARLAPAAVGGDRGDMRQAAARRAPPHGRGSRSPGSSRPSPAPCRRPPPGAPRRRRTARFHSSPPIA